MDAEKELPGSLSELDFADRRINHLQGLHCLYLIDCGFEKFLLRHRKNEQPDLPNSHSGQRKFSRPFGLPCLRRPRLQQQRLRPQPSELSRARATGTLATNVAPDRTLLSCQVLAGWTRSGVWIFPPSSTNVCSGETVAWEESFWANRLTLPSSKA
jgi:hypothetical protein